MSPWLSDLFLNSQSDERLVRLARDGHQQAFAAIVERYRRELSRFAGRLCSDGRAEDMVQQTFLSAFAALQNGSEVKHLRGWLYTILRHHAARACDRSHTESEIGEVAVVGASLEEAAVQRMSAYDALSEINRLPDRQRAALVATAIEGRSRAEVAGRLGLSEGAVRQLVHRARSTVRAAVTAITPFPLLRWLMVRQPGGSDWTKTELVAGAGSASTAVAVKIGAVVVAGLGLAGAIAVRPQASHHRAPVRASSSASGAHGSSRVPVTGPGGLAAARVADATGSIAGAAVGLGTAAAQTAGLVPAAGAASGSSILTRREGGGGDGGRDSSGSRGSDGGDHGGSPVSFSGGDGGSSSGSSGDGGSGGGSTSSDGGSGGGTASATSGSSDGGSSTSSGSTSSDGGSTSSGSTSLDGGSSTSGSSDGGTLSGGSLDGGSGSSDGGVLSGGSTSGTDSSGG